jgi:hypothetical protein
MYSEKLIFGRGCATATAVLVAQLLKYTKKKLHKNYRFCIFNHARKKEFHASIIRFG